ncbi:hypothetical protein FRC12_015875 [Ceratobasidium sp. 428]|nr:hypothetical protein FRC12_015875 [Ceratobasidium sp. 428]
MHDQGTELLSGFKLSDCDVNPQKSPMRWPVDWDKELSNPPIANQGVKLDRAAWGMCCTALQSELQGTKEVGVQSSDVCWTVGMAIY